MGLSSMSGMEAKMGDFMKQKWPFILTCNHRRARGVHPPSLRILRLNFIIR